MPRLSPSSRRAPATALALVMAAVLVIGCTGERPKLAAEADSTSTTAGSSTSSTTATSVAEVAQAHGDAIDVYSGATTSTPAQQLTAADATAAPNIPLVFLVKGQSDDRIEVYLPVPPSGSTGWVDRADVSVSTVPYRIEVALAEHRLRVFEHDDVLLDEPVGLGTADRPAAGTYYVKELLQPPDPSGPYGAYAYGFSGFRTELSSFNSGTGLVGIHGTSDAASVGQDTPDGSIRLTNDVISRLVTDVGLPLGTPVEILP